MLNWNKPFRSVKNLPKYLGIASLLTMFLAYAFWHTFCHQLTKNHNRHNALQLKSNFLIIFLLVNTSLIFNRYVSTVPYIFKKSFELYRVSPLPQATVPVFDIRYGLLHLLEGSQTSSSWIFLIFRYLFKSLSLNSPLPTRCII